MRHIWDKPLYTMEDFVDALYAAFSYNPNLTIVPVVAIYDFSSFYDQFIDSHLRIYKEELTNHGWRIQRVPPLAEEEALRLGLPGIMTNYRKFAAGGTANLMKIEPFTESSDVKVYDAMIYHPRILFPKWIPCEANGDQQAIGMSYLELIPTGEPKPMEFEDKYMEQVCYFLYCFHCLFSLFSICFHSLLFPYFLVMDIVIDTHRHFFC